LRGWSGDGRRDTLHAMFTVGDLGLRISAVFRRIAPDPFVIAILLTFLTAMIAIAWGRFGSGEESLGERSAALLDAWRFIEAVEPARQIGLWKFLEFSMQMCVILVTGHALAVTRPVRGLIDRLAGMPRSTAGAAALVGFVAAVAGLINWGLGLIVGALLARDVGRSLEQRGIPAHYPLLCAGGYMGLIIWHGGLSGSAPLKMTSYSEAVKIIPAEYLGQLAGQGVPLTETIFSAQNFFITGGMLLIIPLILYLLAPKRPAEFQTIPQFGALVDEEARHDGAAEQLTLPDRLDRSRIIAWSLAALLLVALARWILSEGNWKSAGLNQINVFMLALGLLLHGSAISYMNAAAEGARGCAGIIIQFPLYAGIMAMMAASGLISQIAEWFASIGNEHTIPLLSFFAACIVNLFVPSGGGQWGIQGPIALQTGLSAGVAPGEMIMSVAYGDQLTNMLQPFWALPLLAITRVRARDIVGYTALIMVAVGIWITIGMLVF
jgi:short-chain fatty acids transporter